jgi:hypothetical protein
MPIHSSTLHALTTASPSPFLAWRRLQSLHTSHYPLTSLSSSSINTNKDNNLSTPSKSNKVFKSSSKISNDLKTDINIEKVEILGKPILNNESQDNENIIDDNDKKNNSSLSSKVSDLSKDSLIKAKLQQQLQTQVKGIPINANTIPDAQNIDQQNNKDSEINYNSTNNNNNNIRLESFFDSYKVVQDFKNSGFTHDEALILMKYTYFILEEKMNWLDQNYSPKVDLENEAYLFEAAHSELLFEVTNSREISLMNLTNAMIILKRGFNNLDDETIAQIKLNDDIIKMELNQFKHENNLHQKRLNLKNSDLNSRIISDMVSGLKSEIETFRWQLTRAGILSIMIMAVSIIGVWNVTKRMGEFGTDANKVIGPLLLPVHEQTDEESHDYEADWDERVIV